MKISKALTQGLIFSLASIANAADMTGTVVAVSDGDTVTILDGARRLHKVRLAGIDAPETAQPFGQASRKYLHDTIYAKDVEVSWTKRDRYGRIIGKVTLAEFDVCLNQIRRGLAWHYKQYQREQSPTDSQTYSTMEKLARADHAELWALTNPEPPWAFRRNRSTPKRNS
jgi:endonuclease YncB( thermonuclease family)